MNMLWLCCCEHAADNTGRIVTSWLPHSEPPHPPAPQQTPTKHVASLAKATANPTKRKNTAVAATALKWQHVWWNACHRQTVTHPVSGYHWNVPTCVMPVILMSDCIPFIAVWQTPRGQYQVVCVFIKRRREMPTFIIKIPITRDS